MTEVKINDFGYFVILIITFISLVILITQVLELSNNPNIKGEHFRSLIFKLLSNPEVGSSVTIKKDQAGINFGMSKIRDKDTIKSLTGVQPDKEFIGKYIIAMPDVYTHDDFGVFIKENLYIIYDLDRDRILSVFGGPNYEVLTKMEINQGIDKYYDDDVQ